MRHLAAQNAGTRYSNCQLAGVHDLYPPIQLLHVHLAVYNPIPHLLLPVTTGHMAVEGHIELVHASLNVLLGAPDEVKHI